MIKIRKIEAKTKDRLLFRGENLEFKDGYKYILTGKNGSGKTTFLNSLINESKLVDIDFTNSSDTIYQIQNSYFFKNTPKDNFKILSIDIKNVKYDMKTLGIDKLIERNIESLSGGERQKFIFLRSLYRAKETLILDEPFSQMDLKSKEKANKILDNWLKKSSKRMIIMVTHDDISLNTYDYHYKIEDKLIKEVL